MMGVKVMHLSPSYLREFRSSAGSVPVQDNSPLKWWMDCIATYNTANEYRNLLKYYDLTEELRQTVIRLGLISCQKRTLSVKSEYIAI